MMPVFEGQGGYWYFWDKDNNLSEPYDTELEAYAAYREYYRNR